MKSKNPEGIDVTAFMETTLGTRAHDVELHVQPLRGGLDSTGVWRLRARFSNEQRQRRTFCFVIKQLPKEKAREAGIYREVLAVAAPCVSPKLLWIQENQGECHLYLEAISSIVRWPWRDSEYSGAVLKSLAQLHLADSTLRPPCVTNWDYEAELTAGGEELVHLIESLDHKPEMERTRESLPALRRLVRALPELRRHLLHYAPFGSTFIHGDVHPGNVLMKKTSAVHTPVLLDWGRSRLGSPLEDVSSWLQSLGYWEPEARRRHDTLLLTYLTARGESSRITRSLRDVYWLAAASNLLAGAILYHLSLATAPGIHTSQRRQAALQAAEDGLRVIRRADACWTSGCASRC